MGDNAELNNHSLGRLMLLQRKDGSRLVLDGQQRLSTVTLLLSALCDRLMALGEKDTAEEYQGFCQEGRLIPTMYDRPDFHRCLTERLPSGDSSIIRAKRCFSDLAETLDSSLCEEMADAVMNRLSFTAFVVDKEDGMQAVFEKMAMKTQMESLSMDLFSCIDCFSSGDGGKETKSTHWGPEGERLCEECAKFRPGSTTMTPGIPMSPIDVIRNFVFDHYSGDEAMKQAHANYWGPIEGKTGANNKSVEASISAFLEARGFPAESRWGIHKAFRLWWSTPNDASVEEFANGKLMELLEGVEPVDVVGA